MIKIWNPGYLVTVILGVFFTEFIKNYYYTFVVWWALCYLFYRIGKRQTNNGWKNICYTLAMLFAIVALITTVFSVLVFAAYIVK